ncbi:MAG TPA: succinyl-diaminopimelate desuccinylase [Archangium sp.]
MQLGERALELVKIPSVIGNEGAIADHVEAWAKKHYPPEEIVRVSHSFVIGKRVDPRPTVALVGHLDTVPEHPAGNPARLEGDRIHGLGASDMKGALAVMMALAENLPRATLPVNLLLVFYEREEGPFQESGLGPLFEQVPELKQVKFAIAMEPTDEAVQVGCVGTLHATLTFKGQAAHSARPWQGKNAIHAAGSLLADLDAKERKAVIVEGHTFYEVMSITTAKGGRARNVVPESFELNLNYRFAPGKSLETAQADVRALVKDRAEVTFTDLAPSGRLCGTNPYFQALERLSGRQAEAKQAWTDVARFSELGVDAVNYGPGETAQAHQKFESASVSALSRGYEVLRALLMTAA